MTPEMMLRQVLAVGVPARFLISEMALSMRGVLASPMRSSPRAGSRRFLMARR
jgi:hypothetical protein